MKAKFGMIVTEGRGKLGGHVFSKNRGGAYVRTKVTGSNPQTVAQQAARSFLAEFSSAWRGLTQAGRDAWNSAVSNFTGTNVFGDTVTPTGKNLYTGLNVNLANINGTAITTPPLPVAVVEPTVSITDMSEDPIFEITVGNLDTNQKYLIEATAQVSPGVGFFKGKYRVIDVMLGSESQPFSISTAYVAKFGSIVAGQKCAVRVVPIVIATGQAGIGATADTIATA
jgi:hypothetical protein